MHTFDDIFEAFGGPAALAKETGIKPFHAQTMKSRGSIPPGYWPEVVMAAAFLAQRDDIEPVRRTKLEGITLEILAGIAAAKAGRVPEPERAMT